MVSLWGLSTENLAREPDEVAAVLSVIEEKVSEWLQEGFTERSEIRIRSIGKLEFLPPSPSRCCSMPRGPREAITACW